MSKETTNLHCNACNSGIVKLVISKRKDTYTASVKDCNSCNKSFGIKSIAALKVIQSPVKN